MQLQTINRSEITKIAGYTPHRIISNYELESILNKNGQLIPEGTLERKFGIKERHFAADNEQASDLAVAAALKILTPNDKTSIDCLIFAAGSSDMIEPATASIVQQKLQLQCPAMDVKNACNSFTCGLQVANALIVSGAYKKILVVTGEKVSSIIKLEFENTEEFLKRFASLSMGDAGAAALIEPSITTSGIYAQNFVTYGQYWELCTVPGGGSMYPHDGSKVYFEGRTAEMRDVFLEKKGDAINVALQQAGWSTADLDFVFMHHVSENTFEIAANDLGIAKEKFYNVFSNYGNMAAASIPFALSNAVENNTLKKGDKIMLLGLASGISLSVQLLIW
jgi:acyl-CoA:acyl-CoA alkyltransferase